MGVHVIKLPDVGEGVAEAEFVEVHVKPGDVVEIDQNLADVMTDKATVEIPSPRKGKVTWVGADVGDIVSVGSPIIKLEVEGAGNSADEPESTQSDAGEDRTEIDDADGTVDKGVATRLKQARTSAGYRSAREAASDRGWTYTTYQKHENGERGISRDVSAKYASAFSVQPEWLLFGRGEGPDENIKESTSVSSNPSRSANGSESLAVQTPAVPRAAGERPVAAPAVRARARERGVDLAFVHGTGPAGRITHDDLDVYVAGGGSARRPSPGGVADTSIEEVKIIGLRRRIGERMQDAKQRIPHITYVEEIDVTALEDLRAHMNTGRADDQPKLTMLPFLMRAMVRARADFPHLNARYDDEAGVVHRHGGVHIGIATQTDNGLMVPVVRHAEALDLWQSAEEVSRLAKVARDGSAKREELQGSTITITSLGALGGLVSTPVINSPEVAIVGVNKIQVLPRYDADGRVVPRKIMNLSSSFDHRIVDGWDAAAYVQKLKGYLEYPATLFV
ncbi:2-oxo acid dehydrogenase subunit E2 [Parvularcula sp. LCG005]|uniref:2-oxo acid dehydrogenase subunit E2 n=1 Tax=Parvularcula sp. LCG005 TaxID=3078805 RepID=UPI00294314CA|nr:2-oxo acid dehydrogenase subunit E2 [Parvularcula sp. LCG005]WOI53428.1 2-oxo acid dehydrogenase subunit E2 [Parvularcula sp. LCG005]